MKLFHQIITVLPILALIACGNPVQLEKDLKKEQKRTASSEMDRVKLQEKNDQLVFRLQHVRPTTHYNWVLVGISENYSEAEQACSDLGYTLPDDTTFAEFKAEAPASKANDEQISKAIHIKNKTTSLTDGFAWCARAR